jgi:hypothetical protein
MKTIFIVLSSVIVFFIFAYHLTNKPISNRGHHRKYAEINGFFWLPCPLCGDFFGGHEWKDYNGKSSSIKISEGRGKGICPSCTKSGKGEDVGQLFTITLELEESEARP